MHTKESIPNPISLAFSLAGGLKELLIQTLRESGLSSDDIEHVMQNLVDIGVENKLLFSLNRKYKQHEHPFDTFASKKFCDVFLNAYYNSTPSNKWISHLYAHQSEGINSILDGKNTVIATGTGSGKTETFIWPIVDYCLRNQGPGVKAIIVYPMNALASDQLHRIGKLIQASIENGANITFGAFTGLTKTRDSETDKENMSAKKYEGQLLYREEFIASPPNILLTNYVMLDRLLTNSKYTSILSGSSKNLKYITFDELHTYRGNKATHLRGLILRLRELFENIPVMIGTSATLVSGNESSARESSVYSGYLGKVSTEETDDFVLPLFGEAPYNLILPQFEDVEVANIPQSIPIQGECESLGWSLSFEILEGLQNINSILGTDLKEDDLESVGEVPSFVQKTLQKDPFIQILYSRLLRGPISFEEIAQLIQPAIDQPKINTVDLAKSYLSGIAFANQFADGGPLLDFRIHLFLQNIGGSLKLCVNCGKYHSGLTSCCNDCGWPLFKTYRHNILQAIGKISGNELRWELQKESDDAATTFFVLISKKPNSNQYGSNADSPPKRQSLRFSMNGQTDLSGIPLVYDNEGGLILTLLEQGRRTKINDLTIPLISLHNNQQYLQRLLTALLDSLMSQSRKILGFIDNREKASRHIAQLKENFTVNYFKNALEYFSPELNRLPINESVPMLINKILGEGVSVDEVHIFNHEFPIWVARELSIPQRFRRSKEIFTFESPLSDESPEKIEFTPLEQEILEIFLQERAIDKHFLDKYVPALGADGKLERKAYKHIKYRLGDACQHHGICFSGQSSNSRKYTSIVFSEQSQVYKDFIELHGLENIQTAIIRLTDDGNHPELPLVPIDVSIDNSDESIHYYLKPDWIKFRLEESKESSFQKLREKFYLEVDIHNSDINGDKREEIEKKFQEGKTNFLLATSTLEMGIDIGKLSTVLLIGAPPLPSSYAQRAGRAGRAAENKYALIVNFFSEEENHDSYYYDRPKELVAGYISPPTYDPENMDVLSQHVNALLLPDFIHSHKFSLEELTEHFEDFLPEFIQRTKQVFPGLPGLENYLTTDFIALLHKLREKAHRYGLSLKTLYDTGVFPDYGFRHDSVIVIDKESFDSSKHDIERVIETSNHKVIDKYKITYRDPEQAYYKLIPGESTYMAGDEFTLHSSEKYFTQLEDNDGRVAISHQYLWGFRSKDPKREYEIKRFSRTSKLIETAVPSRKTISGVLSLTYYRECILSFRNDGIARNGGEVELFGDRTGCDLKREGIVFEVPTVLFNSKSIFISLLSALDRAIKDRYGLDENDLKLLLDITVPQAQPDVLSALIYDSSGNGAIPFEKIVDEFEVQSGALQRAFDRLTNCPNNNCERGCYLCLRSYGTQYYASEINKAEALNMVRYLLGKSPLTVPISIVSESGERGLFINIFIEKPKGSSDVKTFVGNRSYALPLKSDQNEEIYSCITQALESTALSPQRCLRIIIPPEWPYLKEFLTQKKLSKNANENEKIKFEELLFQLLRFDQLDVRSYQQLFQEMN